MKMNSFLQTNIFRAYTLTYLINEDDILLIKRAHDKVTNPDRWLGIGGKIEKNEDIYTACIREFKEETGYEIAEPILRGTYTILSNYDNNGTAFIFFATKFKGTLLSENREGLVSWHKTTDIFLLPDFAPHQNFFLPTLLKQPDFFYNGVGIYDNDTVITYADNRQEVA